MRPVRDPEEQPGGLSKLLSWVAYPAATVTGFFFGKTSIESGAYDNARFHGAIDDIRDPLKANAEAAGKKAVEALKRGEHISLPEIANPLHNNFRVELAERMEHLEMGTLAQKWSFLQKHQKQNALIQGFTAGAITLGAILAIANSNAIFRAFRKQEEQDSNKSV